MAWTWEAGTPRERADLIRAHLRGVRPLSNAAACDLFNLTDDGLESVLRGADWQPRFTRSKTVDLCSPQQAEAD